MCSFSYSNSGCGSGDVLILILVVVVVVAMMMVAKMMTATNSDGDDGDCNDGGGGVCLWAHSFFLCVTKMHAEHRGERACDAPCSLDVVVELVSELKRVHSRRFFFAIAAV